MPLSSPELDPREIGLFERKIIAGIESAGLFDRVGIPPERFTERSRFLLEKLRKHVPPRDGFLAPDLLRWHGYIFAPTSLPEAGRFRHAGDPSNPQVGVGIDIANETIDQLEKVRVPIAEPANIPTAVEATLNQFNESIPQLKGSEDLLSVSEATIRLQVDTYLVHPFADGNTRTTNLLFQMALHRLCKLEFLFTPHDPELRLARSYAMRPDKRRSIGPLVRLVFDRLKDLQAIEARRNY